MNNEQYLELFGCNCPNCGSENVTGYSVEEYGLTSANRPCGCDECGAEWLEEFELTGYSNLILENQYV